ncbi:hypothetical protein B0F87_107206 [Methylobacter tundripaludum]|uniref:ABC-three component systems C-terminal domain-containing protein n=1 Tax=Methylobacter tundripaludum TaxID=173365 RepID=A0A2S6HC38_9GAMM|nr:ABC-three component system protein [Methylobacter tundripaludum]PPK74963.1 hypothetical protein B0F87_107206 [Methylobacter tundripaludum]
MLESNEVYQSEIRAETVVGRDDNRKIYNTIYNQSIIYREDQTLKKLLNEHELEKQKNPKYQEFSDELNNFFKQKTENKLRDLTQKLVDGDRENFVSVALEAKERVTKKIYKFSLYTSAQEVYTHLLTNIRTTFKHSIESKIKSGKFDIFEIDDLVKNIIIEPFYQTVQGSSLYIDLDELYGLLYLLTGNCHIEWD